MDWVTGAIGAVGQMGAAALSPAPAAPGVVQSDPWSMFDASGWNVNMGGGTIESSRAQSQAPALTGYLPYMVAAGGFLLLWRWAKK